MITDKEQCDFLHSMLAQLEIRGIDWAIVAQQNGISSAHAARMRWHRLNKAKLGTSTQPRPSKTTLYGGSQKRSKQARSTSCKSSTVQVYNKGDTWAGNDVEDGEEEEFLGKQRKKVKLEENDTAGVERSTVKQEDAMPDFEERLYAESCVGAVPPPSSTQAPVPTSSGLPVSSRDILLDSSKPVVAHVQAGNSTNDTD